MMSPLGTATPSFFFEALVNEIHHHHLLADPFQQRHVSVVLAVRAKHNEDEDALRMVDVQGILGPFVPFVNVTNSKKILPSISLRSSWSLN